MFLVYGKPHPTVLYYFPIISSLFTHHCSLTVSIGDLPCKDGNIMGVHRMNSTLGPPLLLKTCVLQMSKEIRDCVASGLRQ